jgi:hypothetical protein
MGTVQGLILDCYSLKDFLSIDELELLKAG